MCMHWHSIGLPPMAPDIMSMLSINFVGFIEWYCHLSNFLFWLFLFVQVPVKVIEGRLVVRVSAHVYNSMEDYQRLADAINEIKRSNLK